MFTEDMTAEELYQELNSTIDDMPRRELRELLGDQGMVGEIARETARNRDWKFDVQVERTDKMTSVSVTVESYGIDDDDEDEGED